MKKCFLSILFSLFFLGLAFCEDVMLFGTCEGAVFYDAYGERVEDAQGLNNFWTCVTKEKKADFSCEYGNFSLSPFCAVNVGMTENEIYLYLIKGSLEVENFSSEKITIYTTVSKVILEPDSSVLAISTTNYEDFLISKGKATRYDSINGQTTALKPENLEELRNQAMAKEEPQQEPLVPEIVTTTVGKGWNYGVKAHIFVPKLNLNIASPDNAKHVRHSLENLDYSLGLYFSYNSLKFGFRADPVNTKPGAFNFDDTASSVASAVKILGSLIDNISYGSQGTVFYLRADRTTDISFVHPMIGVMQHIYSDNKELGLFSEVKTDVWEMTAFADNLSLRDSIKENAGFRFSLIPDEKTEFKAGISLLATNNINKFTEFEVFPGADLSFKVFHNSKVKGILRLYSALSLKDSKIFSVGTAMEINTEHLKVSTGIDVSKGAQISRTVDYDNDAYRVLKEGSTDTIINFYAIADYKYDSYYASAYLNLPVDLDKGLNNNEIIDQNFALKGGAKFGKTSVWAACKFKNLSFDEPILNSSRKLSAGADFDFDFTVLSLEAGYSTNKEESIFLSAALTIAVDKKLITE